MKSCFCAWADRIPPWQRHLGGFHGYEARQHPQTMSADAGPSSSLHGRGWQWCTERLEQGMEQRQRERTNKKSLSYTFLRWKAQHIIQMCVCVLHSDSPQMHYLQESPDRSTRVVVCHKLCPTCMWFPQVRGPWLVAAAEASSLLSRQCVSCPPFRLFRVRVTTLAARRARLALTCGFRVVTCLPMLHYLLPLVGRRLFPGLLSLLLSFLPLLQRLLLQGYARHSRLRLRQGNGRLVVCAVARAGVEE